jgi:hypothetical protein
MADRPIRTNVPLEKPSLDLPDLPQEPKSEPFFGQKPEGVSTPGWVLDTLKSKGGKWWKDAQKASLEWERYANEHPVKAFGGLLTSLAPAQDLGNENLRAGALNIGNPFGTGKMTNLGGGFSKYDPVAAKATEGAAVRPGAHSAPTAPHVSTPEDFSFYKPPTEGPVPPLPDYLPSNAPAPSAEPFTPEELAGHQKAIADVKAKYTGQPARYSPPVPAYAHPLSEIEEAGRKSMSPLEGDMTNPNLDRVQKSFAQQMKVAENKKAGYSPVHDARPLTMEDVDTLKKNLERVKEIIRRSKERLPPEDVSSLTNNPELDRYGRPPLPPDSPLLTQSDSEFNSELQSDLEKRGLELKKRQDQIMKSDLPSGSDVTMEDFNKFPSVSKANKEKLKGTKPPVDRSLGDPDILDRVDKMNPDPTGQITDKLNRISRERPKSDVKFLDPYEEARALKTSKGKLPGINPLTAKERSFLSRLSKEGDRFEAEQQIRHYWEQRDHWENMSIRKRREFLPQKFLEDYMKTMGYE